MRPPLNDHFVFCALVALACIAGAMLITIGAALFRIFS